MGLVFIVITVNAVSGVLAQSHAGGISHRLVSSSVYDLLDGMLSNHPMVRPV